MLFADEDFVLFLIITRVQAIEKNPALARRFQKVQVDEPTVRTLLRCVVCHELTAVLFQVEATIAILRGLKSKYEAHHGVVIKARGRGGTFCFVLSIQRVTGHRSRGCCKLVSSLYFGSLSSR
jgi:hypothetical protein